MKKEQENRRIDNRNNYEKNDVKDTMEDVGCIKRAVLKSVLKVSEEKFHMVIKHQRNIVR
jgi:hypothetical protein